MERLVLLRVGLGLLLFVSIVSLLPYSIAAQNSRDDRVLGESGLPLPRFVAISEKQANMRRGPGEDYPLLYQYRRQGLPLEVVAEYGQWRQAFQAPLTTQTDLLVPCFSCVMPWHQALAIQIIFPSKIVVRNVILMKLDRRRPARSVSNWRPLILNCQRFIQVTGVAVSKQLNFLVWVLSYPSTG